VAEQAGSAYIPVRPDMRGFHQAIDREIGQAGERIGRALAEAIRRGLGRSNPFEPFEEETDRQRRRAPRQGEETAGAFAGAFQRRLRNAARNLPRFEVEADTDPAQRAMAELRARMVALSEKTIGVDIDAGAAMAEMAAIEAELQRLRAQSPNIQIQADIAGAIAQMEAVRAEAARIERERATVQIDADIAAARSRLASLERELEELRRQDPTVQVQADIAAAELQIQAIQAEIARLETDRANVQVDADTAGANAQLAFTARQARELDGKHVGINVGADIGGALAAIASLRMAIAGLGLLAGPQLVAIGAGVAGLAGPLAAAGAGFGGLAAVAAPSLMKISEALKAQDTATKQAAASAGQAQQRALAQAGAQQQLAAAVRQAGYAHQQAVQQVTQAEQQLTQAQQSARQAQEQLTQAAAVADAEGQLGKARTTLAGLSADPSASAAQKAAAQAAVAAAQQAVDAARQQRKENELARKEAQLAYEQAVQRLREQRLQLKRLQADEAAARKAGVEGSDAVRQARQALAAANARVQQSEQALANARANVARVDQQAQDQIASARRAAAAAALSGASANATLGASLAALTPLEQQVMTAWQGLQAAFTGWAEALQPQVLPLLVQGIELLKGALPLLTPIVVSAAAAVRGLLGQLGEFLQSPLFTQFAASLARMAGPAITAFGQIGINLIKTVIGLVNAFAPIGQAFLGVLVQMSDAFARFAISLASSPGFQQFVNSTVQLLGQMGGAFAGLLGQLVPIALQLYQALAPVISAARQALLPVLSSLAPVAALLAGALAKITTALAPVLVVVGQFAAELISGLLPVLTPIVTAITQMAVQIGGLLVEALRQSAPALQQLVLAAASLLPELLPLLPLFVQWLQIILPLVPLVLQLAAVLVTALLPVLRLAITIVVKYWQVIASLLLPVFRLMAATVTWLAGVLTPVIQAIGVGIRWLGAAAMWLWNKAIGPAFRAIAGLARWLYTIVAILVLAPLVLQFKIFAGVATWLWKAILAPVWRGIVAVFRWAYGQIKPYLDALGAKVRSVWREHIQPTFDAIKRGAGLVAAGFRTSVDNISKWWARLKSAARDPVQYVIDIVYNRGIRRMWNAVADLVPGSKKLGELKFAGGGVLPGYTPGRDVHHFVSPTGGALALSGGEAIMRPEWTAAVGERWVQGMNYLARTKGSRAVVQALGIAGDPSGFSAATARQAAGAIGAQQFFLGGVLDKFTKAAKGWFAGGLVKTARKVVDPLMRAARAAIGGTPFGDLALNVPRAMLSQILGHFGNLEGKIGGPGRRAVALARTRAEKRVPYVWGGTDWEHGMDCSALLKLAWERAAPGHTVPRTTYTQRPWLHRIDKPVPGAFGQPHPGHTFMWAGNGKIIEEPFTGATAREVPARHADFWGMPPWLYDDGGWIPPGVHMIANMTRKPEPVLPPGGLDRLTAAAGTGGDTYNYETNLYPRTLDFGVDDLKRVQTRQEALARIGRRR
jgi:phage-related protein